MLPSAADTGYNGYDKNHSSDSTSYDKDYRCLQ